MPKEVEQHLDTESNHESPSVANNAQAGPDTGMEGAMVDVAASAPSHTTARATGYKSKKVHSSPDEILRPISPPACSIRLSFNDHRFKGEWRSDVNSEFWFDELCNRSFSKKFTPETWQDSLRKVHEHVWTKWEIAVASDSDTPQPALELQDGRLPQQPGCVPDSVLQALQPIIDTLPPEKKYIRYK